MRLVRVARAVADPEHVRRAAVPVARQAVHAGQRLLPGQQQRLVGRIEGRLAKLRRGLGGEAAGGDEFERFGEPVRHVAVSLAQLLAHEVEIPAVDLVQIREAAHGEGAEQVQRRRGLGVGLEHPAGIGLARRRIEPHGVDDVAPVTRQLHPVHGLGRGRARLGELASHASDLHHRAGCAVGQYHRHLQQHPEGVADIVGVELGEALRAVAALEQEGVAARDAGQVSLEVPRLASEHERRPGGKALLGGVERSLVIIDRHLPCRLAAPGPGRPSLAHEPTPSSCASRGTRAYTPKRPGFQTGGPGPGPR